MVEVVQIHGAVPKLELFDLVLAGVRLEREGMFETSCMKQWPAPVPQILKSIKDRLNAWDNLEFPFQVFPDGWDSFTSEQISQAAETL